MKTLRKMTREDLEKALNKVDAKNRNVVGVKKAGTVSKAEASSAFCMNISACDNNNVKVVVDTYIPHDDKGHYAIVEDVFHLFADCPVDSLDALISTCDDVINAKTFKDKTDVIGIDPEVLATFPVDVDIVYILKKKYLTDLKAELIGKCFVLSDDDWTD